MKKGKRGQSSGEYPMYEEYEKTVGFLTRTRKRYLPYPPAPFCCPARKDYFNSRYNGITTLDPDKMTGGARFPGDGVTLLGINEKQ